MLDSTQDFNSGDAGSALSTCHVHLTQSLLQERGINTSDIFVCKLNHMEINKNMPILLETCQNHKTKLIKCLVLQK